MTDKGAPNSAAAEQYEMKLELSVLEHLGIRLYSNVAAVLSEAVANAWDADAREVDISIHPQRIEVLDDGCGMQRVEVNARFLKVGYAKRNNEGQVTAGQRNLMGRKGIGKLALFSIAETIQVHTTKDGEKSAFEMKMANIKAAIAAGASYHPTPITFAGREKGTKIVLTDLLKKRVGQAESALRRRIARRFSVIGYRSDSGDAFDVKINGSPITPADREDLKAVEFLWEVGEQRIPATDLPGLVKRGQIIRPEVDKTGHPDWLLRGWLGAASTPKKLAHDEAGSLNGVLVVARGRLIHENVLDRLNFSRFLTSYLTGQIEADFLDSGPEDIATSDRQRVIEDDERYVALLSYLRTVLTKISDEWTQLRNEKRGEEAEENLALKSWIDGLPKPQRKNAKALLATVKGLEIEDERDRSTLYRSAIMAFERLRLDEETAALTNAENWTAEKLLPLLVDIQTFEGRLYHDIVSSRLKVIKQFENLVDVNAKEKVLQEFLFDNLWLLDAGWERAAGTERIEQSLKKEFPNEASGLTEEQAQGRMDIRYRTNAGQHIIIELKRARRVVTYGEVMDQATKYRSALTKVLSAAPERASIRVVVIVGEPLARDEDAARGLEASGTQVIHYEQLISGAQRQYHDYLLSQKTSASLQKILAAV